MAWSDFTVTTTPTAITGLTADRRYRVQNQTPASVRVRQQNNTNPTFEGGQPATFKPEEWFTIDARADESYWVWTKERDEGSLVIVEIGDAP